MISLYRLHVYRSRTFFPLLNVEADSLPFIKGFKPVASYGAEMHENIPAFIILDKAKPLLFVEPLHFSFCQFFVPPFKKIFPAVFIPPKSKKPPSFRNQL